MACVCSAWLRWGALLSAVFALCVQECVDKDEVVAEMSQDADLPSECVLSCTALTYRQIIDGQQKLTVRFKDSQPGDSDDFCWFIHTRCSTWDEVFVVLSIKESVAAERIGLQTTWLPHLSPAPPHMSPTPPHLSPAPPHLSRVLPDACGLRFDVMPHLKLLKQRVLCVRPHGIMGHHLHCPPYLVIVKKKTDVTMEDRDVLRRMERERRSQEVQQEETQYDRIAPLFSEPFKRIRGDELSSRIQNMLGNYEDGSDEFPVERLLDLDGLPALGPPVLPLSPLPASDSSSSLSPDLSIHRPDVPPLTLTLNLPCKLANSKKPTAYVRPMDGQDQVTSDSPRLKASPERLLDLKESSEPSLPPLQSVDASVDTVRVQVVSGKRAEDILQEMTSWPPLLMSICTPSSAEPPKVLNTKEELHGFTALKAHESSDSVQLEPQVASGSSSVSDSNSGTDSENNRSPDQPAAHEPSNTQTQKVSDWHLGRWLERKEDQHQESPGSPCDVIKPSSHDPAGRTEAAGQQGCYSNPSDTGRVADGRQTVGNMCTRGNLPLGSTCMEISQRVENASTRRSKHKREKTSRDTEQKKTTTTDNNISKQTCGKPPLLVKIQLNLLSRIPREPKAAQHRTGLTFSRIPREPRIPQEPRIPREPKAARHRTGLTTACKRTVRPTFNLFTLNDHRSENG